MMTKTIDIEFDHSLQLGTPVFELFPDVHHDDRGWFAEMFRASDKLIDIVQVNRSCSIQGVVRGMHAQKGSSCQAKLVEAVNVPIIDIILDARPASMTFGRHKMYLLDPDQQNKLYVPRGFLHAFVVPYLPYSEDKKAYFSYYCDNVYDKASEVCISPDNNIMRAEISDIRRLCPKAEACSFSDYLLSDKDRAGR